MFEVFINFIRFIDFINLIRFINFIISIYFINFVIFIDFKLDLFQVFFRQTVLIQSLIILQEFVIRWEILKFIMYWINFLMYFNNLEFR